jgi:diaminopimelate decarboxylase
MSDRHEDEILRLRQRLAEVQRLHHEAWLSGLSTGGGFGFHEKQTHLEDEVRSLEARLSELGEDPGAQR